jgi:hypothetical protein
MDRFAYSSGVALREEPGLKRLLYIDQADYNTLHIYLDAKLGLGDDCRLDVKDIVSGESLPF